MTTRTLCKRFNRGGLLSPHRLPLHLRELLVRGLFAVAAFVLISHGCHGPDEDHEPSLPVPTDTQPESPPAP